jgi:signal transduction histidine kinase
VLAEGLGAAASVVFLRRGDALQPAAIWPPGEIDVRAITLVGGRLAEGPGGLRALEVRHQGELLGALGVIRPRGESLSPVEERLLSDLAAQTGVVMHNVRLKAELEERLRQLSRQEAELRRSRERIVAAQDAERRRLERNIHDGAQQHLVALAVKIRLARTLLDRNPEKAAGMVDQLTTELGVAERTLSDLARGIYPASLRDRGLVQALRSEAETLSLRADVRTGELGRYDQEVEAGVYFLCLEALQNVAKHAPGARVQVRVEESGDELRFSVTDDGPGFDPRSVSAGSGLGNIADRAATLGGGARVEAAPGRGVTVSGSIPVRRKEAVPA